MPSLSLGCVFLASGRGKRFGGNKLLADCGGRPLCDLVFDRHPAELFRQTVVVTRYPEVAVSAALRGFSVAEDLGETDDVAATIRLGLAALRPGLDGCLFSVCDQPRLRAETVRALAAEFIAHRECIVAPAHDGRRGNPVFFPAALFGALAALPPGRGGGAVIAAHPELLRLVEVADPRELADADRPEELEALLAD